MIDEASARERAPRESTAASSGSNAPAPSQEGVPDGAPTSERPLRILLFMLHPGYLRNFESTLRELCERGHQVQIGFDRLKRNLGRQLELLEDLLANDNCQSDFVPQETKGRSLAYYGRRARFVVDWLRYLDRPFRNAPKLRRRLEIGAPRLLRLLVRLPILRSATGLRILRKAFVAVDRSIKPRGAVVSYIEQHRPDLILLTPLLEMNEIQGEYLRAARRMGISSGYLVASWDNLTSKGVLHDVPDFMTVWNEAQKREAVELHGIPAERVVVTGACAYDHWFDWEPATSREEFCSKVELHPDRPFLLYVGSSTFIARYEGPYIETWIDRVRRHGLEDVGILVRPHPTNPLYAKRHGSGAPSLYERLDVAVWPAEGVNPTDEASRNDYYDSIYHAAAVVGVNTSALVESAIVGRRVFTLLEEEFRETQEGTLHFEHIASPESGILTVASSMEEHVAQLSAALEDHAGAEDRARRFVEWFIRPFGMADRGTPRMVEAIEVAGRSTPREPDREPWYGRAVRIVLFLPVAVAALAYRVLWRLGIQQRIKKKRKRVDERRKQPLPDRFPGRQEARSEKGSRVPSKLQ